MIPQSLYDILLARKHKDKHLSEFIIRKNHGIQKEQQSLTDPLRIEFPQGVRIRIKKAEHSPVRENALCKFLAFLKGPLTTLGTKVETFF